MMCKPWGKMFRKAMLVLALIVPLFFANPEPAHANIVSCPACASLVEQVAEWAKTIAQYLAEAQQWITENFGSAAKLLAQALQTQTQVTLSQAQINGAVNAVKAGQAGTINQATNVGGSNACMVVSASKEAAEANAAVRNLTNAATGFSAGLGTGALADTKSPAYAAVEVLELCKLGFLDGSGKGRYGQLPVTMKCADLVNGGNLTTPQTNDPSYFRYIDADVRLSSLVDKLQYPLPTNNHMARTRDGHIVFMAMSNNQVTAVADPKEAFPGVGSELDYAAAWKFCEHLQAVASTPTTNSGKPNEGDFASIKSDRQITSMRTAAEDECFRALAYRTSCPQVSEASMQNSVTNNAPSTSCFQTQKKLCDRLSASAQNGGLELSLQGDDPMYATVIANCDTEGISQAMYDAILARRCHDDNYVRKTLVTILHGDTAAIERVVNFDCPAAESAYQVKMDAERERLVTALQSLYSARAESGGGGSARSSQ